LKFYLIEFGKAEVVADGYPEPPGRRVAVRESSAGGGVPRLHEHGAVGDVDVKQVDL
jgi:hypothetical protein